MSFLFLAFAICFEVLGTTCLKLSEGLTKLTPSVGILVFYSIGFVFLALALKRMEVSVVYAIWSGAGTAIIALIGVSVFDETFTPLKGVSLLLIVVGVIGLNAGGVSH